MPFAYGVLGTHGNELHTFTAENQANKNAASGYVGVDAQLLIGGAGIAALNMLKLYVGTDMFTETLTGTGNVIKNLAAGTLQATCPANADDAESVENTKVALSGLPRIVVIQVNSITDTPAGNGFRLMGLADNSLVTAAHWVGLYRGGVASWVFITQGALSTTTNIATPAAGDVYIMYLTSARCILLKNGVHVATHVTNIPTNALGHALSMLNGVGAGAGDEITLGFMS